MFTSSKKRQSNYFQWLHAHFLTQIRAYFHELKLPLLPKVEFSVNNVLIFIKEDSQELIMCKLLLDTYYVKVGALTIDITTIFIL